MLISRSFLSHVSQGAPVIESDRFPSSTWWNGKLDVMDYFIYSLVVHNRRENSFVEVFIFLFFKERIILAISGGQGNRSSICVVWKQRLSIFKLDRDRVATRYPPNPQQCPTTLVCSFVCTKKRHLSAVRASETQQTMEVFQVWIYFFFSTISTIVISLFFFKPGGQMGCFVYKFVLGSLESFISFVYNSILKSLSYILYEWETIGMWKNPIFCCTIPSKNGLTGCKFFGMFFWTRGLL